jgi:hypothetical protein
VRDDTVAKEKVPNYSKALEGGWILIIGLATACSAPWPAIIESPGIVLQDETKSG